MADALQPDAPLLAFETSGQTLGVALWGSRGLLLEKRVQEGARHGQALGTAIHELLALSKLKPAQLGAVAVSLGPGSWTGLRIGLAAAKALAWGSGIGLIGVPSFEALAQAAHRSIPAAASGVLITARNAYSEGLYLSAWRETPDGPCRLVEDSVLALDQIPGWLAALRSDRQVPANEDVRVAGDSASRAGLEALGCTLSWQLLDGLDEIPAGCLAECAWWRLQEGKELRVAAEIHALAPLYLRASDPELRLRRKQP